MPQLRHNWLQRSHIFGCHLFTAGKWEHDNSPVISHRVICTIFSLASKALVYVDCVLFMFCGFENQPQFSAFSACRIIFLAKKNPPHLWKFGSGGCLRGKTTLYPVNLCFSLDLILMSNSLKSQKQMCCGTWDQMWPYIINVACQSIWRQTRV